MQRKDDIYAINFDKVLIDNGYLTYTTDKYGEKSHTIITPKWIEMSKELFKNRNYYEVKIINNKEIYDYLKSKKLL